MGVACHAHRRSGQRNPHRWDRRGHCPLDGLFVRARCAASVWPRHPGHTRTGFPEPARRNQAAAYALARVAGRVGYRRQPPPESLAPPAIQRRQILRMEQLATLSPFAAVPYSLGAGRDAVPNSIASSATTASFNPYPLSAGRDSMTKPKPKAKIGVSIRTRKQVVQPVELGLVHREPVAFQSAPAKQVVEHHLYTPTSGRSISR